MPKTTQFAGNFTSGELSPLLAARADIQRFFNGAKQIKNFAVRPQGGLFRRTGTEYLGAIADMTQEGRLMKFEFSDVQAYMLEFGNLQFRIWKDGQLVTGSSLGGGITAITQAVGAVVTTSSAHGLVVGDRVTVQGADMTEINDREFEVLAIGAGPPHTVTLGLANGEGVNSTNYTAYTAGGTIHKEVVVTTPYTLADLPSLQWAQSANTLFVASPNFQPRQITRTSDTAWTLTDFDFENGPYATENKDKSSVVELIVKFGGRAIITAATVANPAVFTHDTTKALLAGEQAFEDGDRVYISGLDGHADWQGLNDKFYRILNAATTTFQLVDEDTGSTVDSSAFGAAYTGSSGVVCHADTVGDAEDLQAQSLFTSGQALEMFEYIDGEFWTPALQMDKPIGGATNTSKVQLWSPIAKLNTPKDSKMELKSETGGKRGRLEVSFSDVFDRETDPGKLVRCTNVRFTDSTSFAGGQPYGGRGAWATITSFLAGDSVHARQQQDANWSTWTAGNNAEFGAFGYNSGNSGSDSKVIVKNKVTKARLKASSAIFASDDVDRYFKFRLNEEVVNCKIEHFISTTEVRVEIDILPTVKIEDRDDPSSIGLQSVGQTVKKLPFKSNGVTSNWAFGVWHDGTSNGRKNWPSHVVFHEGRLVFANTADHPQTMWFSKSDDFTNFAASDNESVVADDAAIIREIAASEVNPIVWMASGATLLVGTADREWQVKPSQISQTLSPTNAVVQVQTVIGAEENIRPVVTNNSTFFLQRGGRKLREMTFEFSKDGFISPDLNSIAEHIIAGGFSTASAVVGDRMAFKPGVVPTFMVVNTLGDVACMTYEPDQKVAAWWLLETANGGDIIEDVQVIPNTTTKDFDVYFIIRRSFALTTVRYIERMQLQPLSNTDVYMDGWIEGPNKFAAATVAVGLEHLNGENVRVVLDGVDDDTIRTVSNGQVTITGTGQVLVGQTYTSQVETMPLEAGSAEGFAQGKTRRANQIQCMVHDSNSFEFSGDGSSFNEDVFGDDAVSAGAPAYALFSGYRTLKPGGTFRHGRSPSIFIRQERPYPLNILAITGTVKTTK